MIDASTPSSPRSPSPPDGLLDGELVWLPERGLGWYPVTPRRYDGEYWAKYLAYDATYTGAGLTAARIEFVRRYWAGEVCDIGIGGGRFATEIGARGYDVNPHAVAWLEVCGMYHDPYRIPVEAATFWDSLEHIAEPAPLLANVRRWAFVSIPIFRDPEHLLHSKHYRRDEHWWYFTREGFIEYMAARGFAHRGLSYVEQTLGREDIETFAFYRPQAEDRDD